MIVWPEEKRVKPEGREALRRFRDTSAASDLETSNEVWRVVAWPWTSELPQRVLLENEAHGAIAVSMGEGGIWLVSEEPRAVQFRSVESLDRDARGLPPVANN
jgi:hypothetical protein